MWTPTLQHAQALHVTHAQQIMHAQGDLLIAFGIQPLIHVLIKALHAVDLLVGHASPIVRVLRYHPPIVRGTRVLAHASTKPRRVVGAFAAHASPPGHAQVFHPLAARGTLHQQHASTKLPHVGVLLARLVLLKSLASIKDVPGRRSV